MEEYHRGRVRGSGACGSSAADEAPTHHTTVAAKYAVARPRPDDNGIGSADERIRGQRVRTAMTRSWLERVRERTLRRRRQRDRIASDGRTEELDDVEAVATAP